MKQITEDYVSYEIAKLLKEKGFDEPTKFVWYERLPASIGCDNSKIGKNCMELFYSNSTTQFEQPFINNRKIPDYIQGEVYSAPTHQMTLKWLREVHKMYIYIKPLEDGNCFSAHLLYNSIDKLIEGGAWGSYESACEAALLYTLEKLI